MPVSTDTFRNTQKLNLIFAIAAVAMLVSVGLLVVADYQRAWRTYQRQANVWQTAMTIDAADHALNAQQQQQLQQLERQIDELQATLPHEQIAELESRLTQSQSTRDRLTLPAATVKGEIGPKTQQLERALLTNSDEADTLAAQLRDLQENYRGKEQELATLEREITQLQSQLNGLRDQYTKTQKQIDALTRTKLTHEEKLTKINPQGLAALSDKIRNAPLMDWFNPSEKVQQVVVPDIRTDLNFLTVETIDRCNSCHVNIDNPAFEESNLLLFAERQVASFEGQDVDTVGRPVVMVGFWEHAAELAGVSEQLGEIREQTLQAINSLRGQAGLDPVASAEHLPQEIERIALRERGNEQTGRAQWYRPLERHLVEIRKLLRETLEDESFKHLRGQYRQRLTEQFNAYRVEAGLPTLDTNPVLLGHPRLDLYVDVESPHPMKTMGCTSCHEGSGQETHFQHAAHTPGEFWVDRITGAAVPAFLLATNSHEATSDPAHATHKTPLTSSFSLDGATTAHAANVTETHPEVGMQTRHSHDDVKLTDPTDPAPFAPARAAHHGVVPYHSVDDPDQTREAVTQADYWNHKYGWHAVHYMEWEKPMHRRDFVQSSCNKCHTEVFDLQEEAPTLFEGRLLFAQIGCVNCHAVDDLKDDLDIKKVGPSLVHVKEKLSAPMTASWIWSPKAFRPTTKMPHYFMLENNSSQVDILRTRTEVAAITHYLRTTEPASGTTGTDDRAGVAYNPEPLPEGITGDVGAGRKLFNSIGCVACHTNLDEHGREWVVDDLETRLGLDKSQAQAAYGAMSYNERHWYAMEHVPEKISRTGPELSGVGTKLKAGRDPKTAEKDAATWLYNWVQNPQHYTSYSIMPSFRLSEQEASDLTAYLLSLERPGYEPADFMALDAEGKRMLAELVATLKAPAGTLDMAREEVVGMSHDQQLAFLGKKMIGHYGCNGCHLISGFENAASACTNLDDWGLKDPHKLDFGYFDHAFDATREQPTPVWKVTHEGLEADAPRVTHTDAKVVPMSISWEEMGSLDRRPWLYHKLHNPRVYDRGRTAFEGSMDETGFDTENSDVGQPYDKLKMPKFFLTDQQVRALVTYVTSIRKPLVSVSMQQAALSEAKTKVVRGRQIATRFNCYGCHNIEDNTPLVWQYFDVYNPNGSFNYENLNNAPPRLIGQGSKTQPQWLHHFLQNVHPLRPWLTIRMPSFALTQQDASALVEYFAGASQELSRQLAHSTEPIEAFLEKTPDDNNRWFTHPSLGGAVDRLGKFSITADLAQPRELDAYETDEAERSAKWAKLYQDAQFMRDLNDIEYPFSESPQAHPDDPQWLARGEALFNELRCYQCHALGDEEKLLELWKLDNPAVAEGGGDAEALEDENDEEGYGYGDDEEDGYGYDDEEGDGYGDEEEAEAAPTGPVYSGPNLSYTAARLQRGWLDAWLQEPATIQPGTKMPQWFPGGQSAFANYPEPTKQQVHATYGYTGPDQRRLLMDFIYDAGQRGYTPGIERLTGAAPAKVELTPLPPPPVQMMAPEGESGTTTATDTKAGAVDTAPPPSVATPAPPPAPEPTVSLIELHDAPTADHTGQGNGRVIGVVSFEGKPARAKPIRMSADPFCGKAHSGKRVRNESMLVNKDGSMRNVFIYVKSGLSGGFTAPTTPALMDQVGCIYRPHVSGVMAGQPLVIRNSDNTLHNVKMNSAKNGSFNEGMPVKGMVLNKVLNKPEMNIGFRCDVHPWMGAFLHVMEHPFFAVSDIEGRFEITGLPPGIYTLGAIHESKKIAPVTFNITVEPDKSHRIDVQMR